MAEHLNRTVLEHLQEVMGEEYAQLLEAFLKDAEERLALMRAALRTADGEGFWRAAHSFKGSCSNLGAELLAALCQDMESLGRGGRLAEAGVLFEAVEREQAIVRLLMRGELQRYRRS